MVLCENVENGVNHVNLKTVIGKQSAAAVSSPLVFSTAQQSVNPTELPRTTCRFQKKGAELVYTLSHRNRKQLTVVLDTDAAVGICKHSTETKEWIVPCDIAGIDSAQLNGKKQHKKYARFIVHPDTVAIAAKDFSLSLKIEETAKELVSHFIGDQWQLVTPPVIDINTFELKQLKQLLSAAQCYICRSVNDEDRITICYVFKSGSDDQLRPIVSKNLSLNIGKLQSYNNNNNNNSDSTCTTDDSMFGQTVSLRYMQNGGSDLILQVMFTWKINKELLSTDAKDYAVFLSDCGLFIELHCLSMDEKNVAESICERVSTLVFVAGGPAHLAIMQNNEANIEECRRLLEASSIGCQQQQHHPKRTVAEIGRAAAYPEDSNEVDDTTLSKKSSKPLSVFVDGSFEDHDTTSDTTLSSSPTESSDSGVYSLESLFSSQSSSPNLSPVHKTANGLVKWETVLPQQPRQRSTSEGCGLKSILKRTLPAVERRGRFTRSLSECQEEVELKVRTSTNGSSEDIDAADGESLRKKHVSFSERLVQRHSFRPNSSILGQRKKNQKKSKNKLKKKLSRESLLPEQLDNKVDDETDEEINGCESVAEGEKPRRGRLLRSSISEESYVVFGSCVMNEDITNNVIQEEMIEICS